MHAIKKLLTPLNTHYAMSDMKNLDALTSSMSDEDKMQLFEHCELINDPLARDILGKLASEHSPIFADQTNQDFQTESVNVLCNLTDMQNKGYVSSELTKRDGSKPRVRKFTITESGKKFAQTYAQAEINKHNIRPTL